VTTNTSPPFFPTSPSPCLQSSSAPPPRRHETLVPRPVPLSTSPPRDRERERDVLGPDFHRPQAFYPRAPRRRPPRRRWRRRPYPPHGVQEVSTRRSAAPNPCSAPVTATVLTSLIALVVGVTRLETCPTPGFSVCLRITGIRLGRGFWLFCSEEGGAFSLVALFESFTCALAVSIGFRQCSGLN